MITELEIFGLNQISSILFTQKIGPMKLIEMYISIICYLIFEQSLEVILLNDDL